jgi:hypothetical protein
LVWAAGALAAAATLLVAIGVVPLPDFDRILEDASETLGGWAYPAVSGFAFLETGAFVGLLVPGETAVVVGGVVAERGGVELAPLIGLVWLAAAAGDLVSFGSAPSSSPESIASTSVTAAKQSCSVASPGWFAPSRRSWPARRGSR